MAGTTVDIDTLSTAEMGGQCIPSRRPWYRSIIIRPLFHWAWRHVWRFVWGCRGWQLLIFVVSSLIAGALFSLSGLVLVDGLFLAVTAVTATGLTPLNLSTVTPAILVTMCFLMLIGQNHFQPLFQVVPRILYLEGLLEDCKKTLASIPPAPPLSPLMFATCKLEDSESLADHSLVLETKSQAVGHVSVIEPTSIHRGVPLGPRTATMRSHASRILEERGSRAAAEAWAFIKTTTEKIAPGLHRRLCDVFSQPLIKILRGSQVDYIPDSIRKLVVTGNSNFVLGPLTIAQRIDLVKVEVRALKLLLFLVPSLNVSIMLLSMFLIRAILESSGCREVFTTTQQSINKFAFAAFLSVSSFTGTGVSLFDTNMVPFQKEHGINFIVSMTLLAGGAAFPIVLRLVVFLWSLHHNGTHHDTLSFMLAHPRRCYTHLFPRRETWFLVFYFILFSTLELVSFEVLNAGLLEFNALSKVLKATLGLFQGLNARGTGLTILPLAKVSPAQQAVWAVLMYISPFPVRMAIRCTNVYEDIPLCSYSGDSKETETTPHVSIWLHWGGHLYNQLSTEIWFPILGFIFICAFDRAALMDDSKKWFGPWQVLFEVVSAYGNIGLSLGVPDDNYSFAGAMKPASKLVLMILMLAGKMRYLPSRLDRAVALPTEFEITEALAHIHAIQGPTTNDISA